MEYEYEKRFLSNMNYVTMSIGKNSNEYPSLTKNDYKNIFDNPNKKYSSWVTSVSVKYEFLTNDFKLSKEMHIRITEEVLSACEGEIVDINYMLNGIQIIFLTLYKEDVVESFNNTTLLNTILKMFDVILNRKKGFNLSYAIALHTYPVVIFTHGKKKRLIGMIIDNELDETLSEKIADNIMSKKIAKIGMSTVTYNNIIKQLVETKKEYDNWIYKSYDRVLDEEYYTCDIIRLNFNKYIDEQAEII